jgi:hypothetical protein
MTRRDTRPEPIRSSDAGPEEHHRLDAALRAAAIDADDVTVIRRLLLARLFQRPDDFAATAALQALNVFSAGQRTDAPSDAQAQLRKAGLSSLERMRRRRTARVA